MTTPARTLLAAALQNRSSYELIRLSGEPEHFQDLLVHCWKAVDDFYQRDSAVSRCNVELAVLEARRAIRNPKHAEAVAGILTDCADAEVSEGNVRAYLENAARERVGDALSAALAVRRPAAEVLALINEYQELGAVYGEQESEETDWAKIIHTRAKREGGLVVTPRALHALLGGGLLPGHNVTIFGRPESGKTAVAVSLACGFSRRGVRVLYVGNEDPIEDIALRALCNITNKTSDEVAASPDVFAAECARAGGGNLIFRDIAPGTLGEIERLVRQHSPQVLIVDQLRNIRGPRGENNFTQHLDVVAQGIRAIGKRNKLVTISVTQAGDSARGKAVLDDGDIDSSNTGIPGAADVLIGVGVTETLEAAGHRMLSVCKNKLTGRHEYFTVKLDAAKSRVRSL